MVVGALFSGGKDSCLAIHKYNLENIDCLLSIYPENPDSWMFHKPDLKLLKKQAEMLGKKLIIVRSKGEEKKELEDLKKLVEKSKIDKLIIGGIKSNYQGERIKKIARELKIEVISPLWGYSAEKLWQELLGNNFKIIITKISCEGIAKEWLGKIIDREDYEKLKRLSEKYKFGLDFEGGEAESAVLFMPGMKREIKVEFNVKSEGEYRHLLVLNKVY